MKCPNFNEMIKPLNVENVKMNEKTEMMLPWWSCFLRPSMVSSEGFSLSKLTCL